MPDTKEPKASKEKGKQKENCICEGVSSNSSVSLNSSQSSISSDSAAAANGVLSKPEDFRNCKSEGGSWDCAKCDTEGGALPCSLLVAGKFDVEFYIHYGKAGGPYKGVSKGYYASWNGQIGPYSQWSTLSLA